MKTYDKENPETIQALFDSIAKDYDRANSLMSFQLHHWWNRQLITATLQNNTHDSLCYADLCCGTGAIACNWLKRAPSKQKAYLIDFCQEMLAYARVKSLQMKLPLKHDINFL